MHLYKSLGILLKDNNKLKNSNVLFIRKKHNILSSFCRGAPKVILNDSSLNCGHTRKLSLEFSKL